MLKHVAATPHVNHMTYSLSQRSAHMLTCSYADMFVKKLRVQKLEADLLTYFPSLFNMASELLSEAELQTAWNQLSVLRPQLDEECEFQLESCKEVLRFVLPFAVLLLVGHLQTPGMLTTLCMTQMQGPCPCSTRLTHKGFRLP